MSGGLPNGKPWWANILLNQGLATLLVVWFVLYGVRPLINSHIVMVSSLQTTQARQEATQDKIVTSQDKIVKVLEEQNLILRAILDERKMKP